MEYFVDGNITSSGDGLTELNAFKTIQEGIDAAYAGDTVWVKAAKYVGGENSTTRSGTSSNPIKIIGYLNTVGDIVSTQGPTYTKAMFDADSSIIDGGITVLDSSDMPLIEGIRVNEDPDDARAFTINHSFIQFENLKIQYYQMGFIAPSGNSYDGLLFKNIIMNELGNWDASNPGWDLPFSAAPPAGNLSGQGFYLIDTNNTIILNSSVYDAGAAAYFPIRADNLLIDYCEAYSTRTGNASDYLFDFVTVTNSTLSNYYAYREDLDTSKMHLSRAVMLQLQSNDNTIMNGTHVNLRTQLEVQSSRNVLKNINVIGNGQANQGNIQISGESNDNIFLDWTIDGTEGIQFLGANDTRQPGVSHVYSGNNNYFINFVITNVPVGTGNAIFSYHRLGFSDPDDGGTNYVIGLTADNCITLVNTNRTGTLHIYNSTFSNITNYDTFSTSGTATDELVNLNFYNCNFYNNGFVTPTNNVERTLVNTTALNPMFNPDYTLQEASPLRDIGMDASTINSLAATDYIGTARPQNGSYDIGAYEYSIATGIPNTDGTGSVDDTISLQAWLDSGSTTKPLGNEIYLVSGTLDIDQSGAQEVDFNGATIIVSSYADRYAIDIDKPDRSLTTLKNLTIDGKDLQRNGVRVDSPIYAENVNLLDFYSPTQSIVGWLLDINLTNYGDFTWKNCDVTKMYSEYNSIIGDGLGSARAYDIQVNAMPPDTFTVLIEDFVWDGFYGDDGGPIRVDDNTSENMSVTNNSVTLRNGSVTAFTRRGIKMAMDNITIDNVFYKSITTSNPYYQYAEPAGLIGARPLDTDPNGLLDNIVIKNCTFDGSGNYPWALIDKANTKWSNNTFINGAGIRIGNNSNSEVGDVVICGSNFGTGSKIHQQLDTVSNAPGTNIIIDSNNIADANYLEFTTLSYTVQEVLDCLGNVIIPIPLLANRNQNLIYWRI